MCYWRPPWDMCILYHEVTVLANFALIITKLLYFWDSFRKFTLKPLNIPSDNEHISLFPTQRSQSFNQKEPSG